MNIAIIGAGVLGRLISLQLLNQNHDVTLMDRQSLSEPNNAAWVSAGMLCPLGEIINAPPPVLNMGWRSLAMWPDILKKLQADLKTDNPVYFQQRGSIALAFDQDRASFKQWQQQMGRHENVSEDDIDWLNGAQLHEYEPGLNQFNQGALLKAEGQLCNRSFIQHTTALLHEQATLLEDRSVEMDDLERLKADYDWVIDCRGHGAIQSPWLVTQKMLRGVRGEVVRVHCPDVSLQRPIRVLHPSKSIYIVPKPGAQFVIGATEVESHSEREITVKSTLELLSTLYCVHPAFAEASVIESRVGIRCAYPNNQPQVHQDENLISANGGYRHGWLTGPALADQVVQRLEAA